MTQFKEGDEIEMIQYCSGNKIGERHIVTNHNGRLQAKNCSCSNDRNWKLIKSAKTTINKFKIGDKVKYISNHYTDSQSNPKWGGNEGEVAGTITEEEAPNSWCIKWDNGEKNSGYKNTDLELINPPKKKSGLSNLKAAQKALRKSGPKYFFEAEATIKIKIEIAGTEADAMEEILNEYDNYGMSNLVHKQLKITGIQKL